MVAEAADIEIDAAQAARLPREIVDHILSYYITAFDDATNEALVSLWTELRRFSPVHKTQVERIFRVRYLPSIYVGITQDTFEAPYFFSRIIISDDGEHPDDYVQLKCLLSPVNEYAMRRLLGPLLSLPPPPSRDQDGDGDLASPPPEPGLPPGLPPSLSSGPFSGPSTEPSSTVRDISPPKKPIVKVACKKHFMPSFGQGGGGLDGNFAELPGLKVLAGGLYIRFRWRDVVDELVRQNLPAKRPAEDDDDEDTESTAAEELRGLKGWLTGVRLKILRSER